MTKALSQGEVGGGWVASMKAQKSKAGLSRQSDKECLKEILYPEDSVS